MKKSGNESSVPVQSETPNDSSKFIETENLELLNSRLDEQIQLFMILKQSKEDTDAKCLRLDEEHKELTKARDEAEKKLKDSAKKVTKLTDQLKTMQLKHDDLLAFVRLCNKHNEELSAIKLDTMEKNANLYEAAKLEVTEKIDSLNDQYMELKNECLAREKMIREHKQSCESTKKKYRTAIANLKKVHQKDVRILVDHIQTKKTSLLENEANLAHEEEELIFETPLPDEIAKLEVKNKSLITKVKKTEVQRVFERKKSEHLQETVSNLEKKLNKLNASFDQQAAEVLENAEVQEFLTKIKDAEMQLNQTEEEMETYKKESQERLQEARELNKTLRHFP